MRRRKFIGLSSMTVTWIAALRQFESPVVMKNDLKIFATNWGFPGSIDHYCEKVAGEGYDGIEIWWPMQETDQRSLFSALQKHKLQVGFLCGAGDADPRRNLEVFTKMVDAAARNSYQKPVYINCHSGKDYFTFEQCVPFIEHTIALSRQTGIPICHETHRGRIMFAAHITRQFIERFPDLRLTLDVSHWCNVHESLLSDQGEAMQSALDRVDHIHARIGHPEGPQVNDPRAPEWNDVIQAHFKWWDQVAESKKRLGKPLTFLTEFGPPDYMPTLPFTRQPLADQWAINVHMMHLLRKRYG